MEGMDGQILLTALRRAGATIEGEAWSAVPPFLTKARPVSYTHLAEPPPALRTESDPALSGPARPVPPAERPGLYRRDSDPGPAATRRDLSGLRRGLYQQRGLVLSLIHISNSAKFRSVWLG